MHAYADGGREHLCTPSCPMPLAAKQTKGPMMSLRDRITRKCGDSGHRAFSSIFTARKVCLLVCLCGPFGSRSTRSFASLLLHLHLLVDPSYLSHTMTPASPTTAGPPKSINQSLDGDTKRESSTTTIPLISTAHGFFLESSSTPGHPPLARILRGVNLSSSSKYPTFLSAPEDDTLPQSGNTREERDANRAKEMGYRTDLPAQEPGGKWDEAESGGRDGWFVNRPMHEEWADVSGA